MAAVYHMYYAEIDADVAAFADPALRRDQACTNATDLSRRAYRDPVAYRGWKGFFENRETTTLEQMTAERAMIGRTDECVEKLRLLSEGFGITYFIFGVNFCALPHHEGAFDAAVCRRGASEAALTGVALPLMGVLFNLGARRSRCHRGPGVGGILRRFGPSDVTADGGDVSGFLGATEARGPSA
jgi:hypothetical protein